MADERLILPPVVWHSLGYLITPKMKARIEDLERVREAADTYLLSQGSFAGNSLRKRRELRQALDACKKEKG